MFTHGDHLEYALWSGTNDSISGGIIFVQTTWKREFARIWPECPWDFEDGESFANTIQAKKFDAEFRNFLILREIWLELLLELEIGN